MKDSLSVAIPCRGSEPGLRATLESLHEACLHQELPAGLVDELLICINGIHLGEGCAPLEAAREFCQQWAIGIEEIWLDCQGETLSVLSAEGDTRETESEKRRREETETRKDQFAFPDSPILRFPDSSHRSTPFPRCTILLTERKGKPPAWNTLWQRAQGTAVLFADADVRIDRDALYAFYARMQREPALDLVAAREVPFLSHGGTLWSRMGAIPYRFDFGNAGGRLLLLRKTVLPNGIPDNLLLEDAWLTVAVGRTHVAKELNARVFFVPPVTWRDYFAERVRTEGGKLQILREHGQLLTVGPIAQYQWSHFWRELSFAEYPLVLLSMTIRGVARLWAQLALTRKDFYSLYHPFSLTKEWGGPRE